MAKRATYAESRKTGYAGACVYKCAGGNKCVCRSEIRHFYHCCREVGCECRDRLRKGRP